MHSAFTLWQQGASGALRGLPSPVQPCRDVCAAAAAHAAARDGMRVILPTARSVCGYQLKVVLAESGRCQPRELTSYTYHARIRLLCTRCMNLHMFSCLAASSRSDMSTGHMKRGRRLSRHQSGAPLVLQSRQALPGQHLQRVIQDQQYIPAWHSRRSLGLLSGWLLSVLHRGDGAETSVAEVWAVAQTC